MIVSTNKGNPNTLKFIIAANIAGKEISVNEVALTRKYITYKYTMRKNKFPTFYIFINIIYTHVYFI